MKTYQKTVFERRSLNVIWTAAFYLCVDVPSRICNFSCRCTTGKPEFADWRSVVQPVGVILNRYGGGDGSVLGLSSPEGLQPQHCSVQTELSADATKRRQP